jgi:hypothetical protein
MKKKKKNPQNREREKNTSNKVLISNLSNSSEPVSKRRSVTVRDREREIQYRAIENTERKKKKKYKLPG